MRFFTKFREEGEWHLWFAWHPVWAWDKERLGIVWLEKVLRKRQGSESLSKYSHKVL